LGSDDVGEDTAEITDDTNSATAHKRPREESTSNADIAAVLSADNGSIDASRDDSAADAALEVKSLANTLQMATQSITAVVEQLAEAAKRQAEAADRLAAAPSAHNQHQPRLLEQQQTSMRGQLALQQQMFWQQHWLHQQQSSWQHHYWQQYRQLHRNSWH
jgi:hypothetical protein